MWNFQCINLETINNPNNNQYSWINRRELEIETKRNWQVIFDKYKDLLTQNYRRELNQVYVFVKKFVIKKSLFFMLKISN